MGKVIPICTSPCRGTKNIQYPRPALQWIGELKGMLMVAIGTGKWACFPQTKRKVRRSGHPYAAGAFKENLVGKG